MAKYRVPKEESRDNHIYNNAIKRPVSEKTFLLEAGQGKNTNGNVFALLRYIRGCSEFDDHRVVLSLVKDKQKEALVKMRKYGISNVDLIEFGGDEYRKVLGTAHYLITDNSFPAYFYKRPEQVYLNTWHGTPLKALGRKDIENAISIANVQANMAKADYLLHPNSFTKDIMMKDYMMERVFRHRTVIMDYPRNDALYKEEYREEIVKKFGLEGKRIIAYMPTWRGTGRDADITSQVKQTEQIIAGLSGTLAGDEVLFVNLHFLLDAGIDYSTFENVCGFPPEYETYDFLAACDVLITDYSSVSIDYALTGKEIILFLYDYDRYKKEKGFYLDVKELPFKKAYTIEEVEECLRADNTEYQLDDSLMCGDRGNSAERLIRLITERQEEGREISDYSKKENTPCIAYFDNINTEESRAQIKTIEKQAEKNGDAPVVMFATGMRPETIETLKAIDDNVEYVRISGHLYCSNNELRLLEIHRKTGLFGKRSEAIYTREAYRQIMQFRASSFEVMQCRHLERKKMLDVCKHLIDTQNK